MMDDTIDFDAINRAALSIFQTLVQDRFPNGKLKGNEFTVGNLQGDAGESLSINVKTGKWADFATSDCGGDPISLFAAADYAGSQIAAADWLGHRTGVIVNGTATTERRPTSSHVREQVAAGKQNPQPKPADTWKQLIPPPADMPKPTAQQLACDMLHEYCGADDRILHYVRRFEARNGKRKEFFPLTPGVLNGKIGWHAKHPDAPRPLYGLNRLSTMPNAPFMLLEGEKKADAAQRLFPDYACVAWSGGCKADHLADETPLLGRQGIIWGDADKGGQEAAARWAKRLQGARMVSVDGLADGFDADDLEAQGCDDPEDWLAARLPPEPEASLWSDEGDWEEKDIPVRPWIVKGYALRGAVTAQAGPGGGGKSLLTIAHSVALALDRPYGRFVPEGPCRVMIYNVEDDRDEQRRRLSAILRRFGATPKDISGKIVRVGPKQVGTLLEPADPKKKSGALVFTKAMGELEDRIKAFRPDVLYLDPLVEMHDVEENDNGALRTVFAHFRALAVRYNMAVIVLHHTSKVGGAAAGDPNSLRGASSIVGAARVVLTVMTMSEDDAKTFGISLAQRRNFFRVDDAKSNYSPLEAEEWFEKIAYQLDNGEAVAAAIPWEPPDDLVTPEKQTAIEEGVAKGSPHGAWARRLSDDPRSIKHLLIEHGITAAQAQKRVIESLFTSGFTIGTFKDSRRHWVEGIRHPDGRPSDLKWKEE